MAQVGTGVVVIVVESLRDLEYGTLRSCASSRLLAKALHRGPPPRVIVIILWIVSVEVRLTIVGVEVRVGHKRFLISFVRIDYQAQVAIHRWFNHKVLR